jgi:hypothetical protein
MSALTDDQWEQLARGYADQLASHVPDWTDQQDSDPGVTLVQIFAFLAESLLHRSTALPDRARTHLRDAVQRLEQAQALAGSTVAPLTRVRYFTGQLLTSADFETEQTYVRAKHRRHNLLLHGAGIVSGLDVTLQPYDSDAEPVVSVSPGVAIGPDGEELVVTETMTTSLSGESPPRYVTLRAVDRELDPDSSGQASRIEEGVEIAVVADVPTEHLPIGRVAHAGGAWRVDGGFKPLRSIRS